MILWLDHYRPEDYTPTRAAFVRVGGWILGPVPSLSSRRWEFMEYGTETGRAASALPKPHHMLHLVDSYWTRQ